MKIVLFGGNGFIGKHLHKLLIQEKNKVSVFGNKKYTKVGSNLINYNKNNFKKIIEKYSPDVIIFFSGNSYPNNNLKNQNHDFNSNNAVLHDLLISFVETNFKNLFIYSSSITVYGSVLKKKFIDENYKLNPESNYGFSKLLAEKQIEYFSKKYKLNSTILRLSSVYGPGLRRQVIYKILKKSLTLKSMTLDGSKNDSRQLLYVEDCVKMIFKLIKLKLLGFNLFNVSAGNKIKITDIIKISNKILKKKIRYKFINKLKSPILPAISNKKLITKIRNIKITNINLGIKKTLEWIKCYD